MKEDTMEAIAGFIVEGEPFYYLNGEKTGFRRHSENHTGFVHEAASLLTEGAWALRASCVYPAEYNPKTLLSRTTGEGIPFSEFKASQLAAQ